MIAEGLVICFSALASILIAPLLWRLGLFTIVRMILVLFIADIAMTIEAAFYADLVLIAFLHVVTIPAFFVLIYFDLVKQHRTYSRCFICGEKFLTGQEIETVTRNARSEARILQVHKACIRVENKERKSFSQKIFKKGIPE